MADDNHAVVQSHQGGEDQPDVAQSGDAPLEYSPTADGPAADDPAGHTPAGIAPARNAPAGNGPTRQAPRENPPPRNARLGPLPLNEPQQLNAFAPFFQANQASQGTILILQVAGNQNETSTPFELNLRSGRSATDRRPVLTEETTQTVTHTQPAGLNQPVMQGHGMPAPAMQPQAIPPLAPQRMQQPAAVNPPLFYPPAMQQPIMPGPGAQQPMPQQPAPEPAAAPPQEFHHNVPDGGEPHDGRNLVGRAIRAIEEEFVRRMDIEDRAHRRRMQDRGESGADCCGCSGTE